MCDEVCMHLSMCVVVDVAGRDHMTDWISLCCHFLLHQERQIHDLNEGKAF